MQSVRHATTDHNCSTSLHQTRHPATGDVTTEWADDVIPELRRLADGVERLQRVERCQEGTEHTAAGAEPQGSAADGTEPDGEGAAAEEESGSTGGLAAEVEDRQLRQHQV